MSLAIAIIGLALIIGAIWIDHNPNAEIVKNNGLKSISGYMFWIGILIFVFPIIVFGVLIGGIAILK